MEKGKRKSTDFPAERRRVADGRGQPNGMKKRKMFTALALATVLFALWAAPAFAVTYATVVGGWLRLRSGPSYTATVIASYRSGTVVSVISTENGWSQVQTPDYRVGFMDARYLSTGYIPPSPTPTPATRTWTEVNRTAWVTSANGRGVRLRSAPVVNTTNVVGLYPVGRTVTEIRRSSDGWSYIRIDKKYGYMMSQYLTSVYNPANPAYPPYVTPAPFVPVVPTNPGWGGATTYLPIPSPTPVPTATPTPAKTITSAKVDPYQPTVGDTIKVIVEPSDAQYAVIWYNEQGTPLATTKQYKTTASDAGHIIYVRVIGQGDYANKVADAYTGTVKPAE